MKIAIAQGHSADSISWKNKKIYWPELVEKLSTAIRTSETMKEYELATKAERSKIKDNGGYVGGYLRGGKRLKRNIVFRQLLTLDLDFANADVWDTFEMMFDNAAVLHSTHSHTEENPKYRLVMPINRECTPEEYVAIGRRVAGLIDIELFDNTGFQPSRLMFWPSCSKDAEYVFKQQDGDWLDADAILATYADWTDSSLWPTSKAHADAVLTAVTKQQDPTQKNGVVGAFCRAYTVSEAIEAFLPNQYSKLSDGRYTYAKGSTAGGLVLYDDKFAYSHHGTDPISGQLCNAFDLVRVHKFEDLDEESRARGVKRPSYAAMQEFATRDKAVKRQIAKEKLGAARAVFGDPEPPEASAEPENLEWVEDMDTDKRGAYRPTANNLNLIFENDPVLRQAFKFNEFDQKRYIFKAMPWHFKASVNPEPMRNVDYAGVRNYIETVYNISSSAKVEDALSLTLEKNSYHPLKDYLNECGEGWDGKPRLSSLLVRYLGAKDSVYAQEIMKIWATAAVARVFEAGRKFDLVLTLVGEQGAGKSQFFRTLGNGWTSDSFTGVKGKEAYEQLQGAWIIEVAELSGFRKDDIEAVKHFISKQEDTFRPAYGRSVETFKRQCVFGATTNHRDFLKDDTGNRRFLPVDTDLTGSELTPFDLTGEYIAQIWGEAVDRYRKGGKLYLTGEAKDQARLQQNLHREVDERTGLIDKYLELPLPENWDKLGLVGRQFYLEEPKAEGYQRETICVPEIWCECLNQPLEKMDRYRTRDINKILKSFKGWEAVNSTKNFPIYGRQRYYKRRH